MAVVSRSGLLGWVVCCSCGWVVMVGCCAAGQCVVELQDMFC